jgi:hypothetical protein
MLCFVPYGLAISLMQASAAQPPLSLEVRVFDGGQEVTSETHVTVHRAGERADPVAQVAPRTGRLEVTVPAGIYDIQVIHERAGRVLNIRWAERLVVMAYPDEGGHHLEVVNFKGGFGALQVRVTPPATAPDVTLYQAGARDKPAASPWDGPGYSLFVVPAGRYDVLARQSGRSTWHTDLDVPLDRTRLWLQPDRE